ncbi:MAG: glutamine--fructose-6-phosphate transaminase (isomerizing) [Candidatus Zipacnadales bacterium]
MCGIVGYIGTRRASTICFQGLQRLEYRGYDSAGIAAIHDGKMHVVKRVGKLKILGETLEQTPLEGHLAIGHTRWATHGKPSETNSHPHLSCDGRIAVVHNGIIENYAELRDELTAEGHTFKSQTDTEVIAHLIEKFYEGDLFAATLKAIHSMRGAYAIAVVCESEPDRIVAARMRSPLVIGIGEGENYVASDMAAVRPETDRVYVIDDGEAGIVTREAIHLFKVDGTPIEKEPYIIPWPAEAAAKGDHRHFMHKEIHEQPEAMRACLAGRIPQTADRIILESLNMTSEEIRNLRKVILTACGTAYHAGLVGRFMIEKLARIPAECDLAAELQARDPVILDHTLGIVISQSGETMDTLLALRELKAKGAKVVAVVNRVDSVIARESHGVVYIQAGPEIGVASTKAYTGQILTLEMIAVHFAEVRRTAPEHELQALRQALLAIPDQAAELLSREAEIVKLAEKYWQLHNALYLGRGINLPSAMEGALKLKEISYVHAEAYSAGEMKHGPIALVEPSLYTVAIAVRGQVYDQMVGNMQEIRARSGPVIGVVNDGDEDILEHLDDPIFVPPCPELVSPVIIAVPLQLFAYHIADIRGEDIDQPRNLAKTVTVE